MNSHTEISGCTGIFTIYNSNHIYIQRKIYGYKEFNDRFEGGRREIMSEEKLTDIVLDLREIYMISGYERHDRNKNRIIPATSIYTKSGRSFTFEGLDYSKFLKAFSCWSDEQKTKS